MKELTCTVEKNGFNAFFFPGTVQPNKALICLGASGCNEATSVVIAKQFIKAGFSVLVLGFYMWKGMSNELRRIPVEYVENAVNWLKTEKQIEVIGVTGISTGAGYALLSASLIPGISAVMVASPYDYVMEACKPPKSMIGRCFIGMSPFIHFAGKTSHLLRGIPLNLIYQNCIAGKMRIRLMDPLGNAGYSTTGINRRKSQGFHMKK